MVTKFKLWLSAIHNYMMDSYPNPFIFHLLIYAIQINTTEIITTFFANCFHICQT